MEHKNEIINTRVGGLGSSDANMVAGIGERGFLNHADRKRIAIMLGMAEQRQFSTKAIETGNIIEEAIGDMLAEEFGNKYKGNPRYAVDLGLGLNFRTSNHIDFEVNLPDKLIWFEHKSTIHGIDQASKDYRYQLAWHTMLGKIKAEQEGKTFVLMLSHYDTNEFDGIFDDTKLDTLQIISPEHYIDTIKTGLQIINEAIKDFEWSDDEGMLYASELPAEINNKCEVMAEHLRRIKELTEQVDAFKSKMCELMVANNVKSIVNDYFTITLTEQSVSTTFDKTKFTKEHPELVGMYEKKTTRKAFVTIKTK